ncbi:MAG: thermonuclease family protein [Desulfamplus sp.]|nr:thermonuclease family protein [Desulfamplus sp.]
MELKRQAKLSLILYSIFILVLWASPLYSNSQAERHIPFKVVQIYDGDSMKVKGGGVDFVVRLIGIDAPESGGRKSSKAKPTSKISQLLGIKPKKSGNSGGGQPFNKESKKALISLIGKKDIYLKSYGTDRYNRVLAEIFTDDGTLVNLEMVKFGMAEVYRGATEKGFDVAPYKKAESEAKRAEKGIWSLGSDYKSPKEWRKNN